jgi:hypothetical protein
MRSLFYILLAFALVSFTAVTFGGVKETQTSTYNLEINELRLGEDNEQTSLSADDHGGRPKLFKRFHLRKRK